MILRAGIPRRHWSLVMSRYLIEREFPDGLGIPQDEGGASLCRKVIDYR
jgi:hypothetical protein